MRKKPEINPGAILTLRSKSTTEIKETLNYYYELVNPLLDKTLNNKDELGDTTYNFIEIHLQLICIYERELVRRRQLFKSYLDGFE
jgi:hypothetical protein